MPRSIKVGSIPIEKIRRTMVEMTRVMTTNLGGGQIVTVIANDANIVAQTKPDKRGSNSGKQKPFDNQNQSKKLDM